VPGAGGAVAEAAAAEAAAWCHGLRAGSCASLEPLAQGTAQKQGSHQPPSVCSVDGAKRTQPLLCPSFSLALQALMGVMLQEQGGAGEAAQGEQGRPNALLYAQVRTGPTRTQGVGRREHTHPRDDGRRGDAMKRA